jgi:type I restriction enzyme S subunit
MSTVTLEIENKKMLVPKLRFQEFEENWETIILGDLLTFKNGLNSDKEKYGKGVKFINVLDILNNDFINYDKIIGSVEVTEKEFEKNEVSYGDILFQRSSETRAEVGQANVYLDRNKSSVFGGFVIRGKAKSEYEPLFMNYLLRTPIVRKEITDKSGGSTRYNVGQDTLSKVKLTTTTLPEQQKIGSFLSAVDEKTQQLSRKKELLEQYKKGVMQQLFSGKLRFKDENGEDYADWEEKKLGDVAKFSKGKGISKSEVSEDGINECIRYGELYTRYGEVIQNVYSKTNFDINKAVVSQANDVIIPASGETQIDIATASCVMKSGVILGGDLNIIRTNNNGVFLSYYLNSAKKLDIANLAQGISVVHLYSSQLALLNLNLPTLPEQQKIANFLSSIDTKIESVNKQITQTQTFKKGLLQGMFV